MNKFPIRRISKVSVLIAGVITLIFFVPQFLLIAAILDISKWSSAFVNLLQFAFIIFLAIFIGIILLATIVWLITTFFKKKTVTTDSNATKKDQILPKTLKPFVVTQPLNMNLKYVVSLIIGGLSTFIYLLYLVGRTYFESYLAELGTPKGIINYTLADYVYFGAHIDVMLIALAFTAIVIGFAIFWLRRRSILITNHYTWDLRINFSLVLFNVVVFAVILVFFTFVELFRTDLDSVKAVISFILICCTGTAIFLIVILYDPVAVARIHSSKITRYLFVSCVSITLLIFPYMSAKAWGSFKGAISKIDTFPQIELCANYQLIDEIQWQPTAEGTFKSHGIIYLLANTNEYMVLKIGDKPKDIFIIKFADVLSTRVLHPQK